jgi:hypothetical protein
MQNSSAKKINWHFLPELMLGINKNWMLHAEGFLSNRNGAMVAEGASIYAKYRMLSIDDVHAHTRVALYGLYAKNNSDVYKTGTSRATRNRLFEAQRQLWPLRDHWR